VNKILAVVRQNKKKFQSACNNQRRKRKKKGKQRGKQK